MRPSDASVRSPPTRGRIAGGRDAPRLPPLPAPVILPENRPGRVTHVHPPRRGRGRRGARRARRRRAAQRHLLQPLRPGRLAQRRRQPLRRHGRRLAREPALLRGALLEWPRVHRLPRRGVRRDGELRVRRRAGGARRGRHPRPADAARAAGRGGPGRLRRQRPGDAAVRRQRHLRGAGRGRRGGPRGRGRRRRGGGRGARGARPRAGGGRGVHPAAARHDAALHAVPARAGRRGARGRAGLQRPPRRRARGTRRRGAGRHARGHPGLLRRAPDRPREHRHRGDHPALPVPVGGGRGGLRGAAGLRPRDRGAGARVLRRGAPQRHGARGVRRLRRGGAGPGADPAAGRGAAAAGGPRGARSDARGR